MKARAIVLALAAPLLGCHEFYKALHRDSPAFDNRSAYPDGYFLYVWSETEAYAGVDIPLDGVLVTIHESAAEFEDACPDVYRLGCHTATNIDIRGSVGTNFTEVGTEVAHQLGHMRLMQEGGDGAHRHAEWWDEGGIVDQVHALLAGDAAK